MKLQPIDDRMRAILDMAPDAIVTINQSGIIEGLNPATTRLFGYSEKELIGQNVKILMPPPYADEHDGYLERYLRTDDPHIIGIGREVEGRRKDGSIFPLRLSVGQTQVEDSRLFMGIMHDLTERHAVESRAVQLGTILEDSINEVYVFDGTSLKFKLVNRGGRENLGYSWEELVSLTPVGIKPEFDEDRFRSMIAPLHSGQVPLLTLKTVHQRKDGSEYPVEIHLQYRRTTDEFIAITLDITDRVTLTQQLLQSQKMEAIGTLAGGIAHDFNNLLTSIRGSSEILLDHLESGSRLARTALRIRKAADRATALTTRLLGFSRKQVTQRIVFDLNEAVREARELFVRTLPEDVELKLDLSSDALFVRADESQVAQILMNLVVNAGDAMAQGGRLLLKTTRQQLTQVEADRLGLAPGDFIALIVRDTGEGISPETRSKIFDPFFTTKDPGKGTGLGLATVFGIVRDHGGVIDVESEVGFGSTFKVFLPEIEAPLAVMVSPMETSTSARGTGETILLVEDDEIVRELFTEVLAAEGYVVIAAADSDDALARSQQHAGAIDLLITDVVMPGLNGFALAKELRFRTPRLRVLYMSGYTDQILADRGDLRAEDPFIRKPFENNYLLRKVREVLGSDQSGSE